MYLLEYSPPIKGGAVVLLAALLQACACFPEQSRKYCEVYVRALDENGVSVVPARILTGDTGQVLTTNLAPTAIVLSKRDGWKEGQVIPIVLDAPGFRSAVHLIRLSRCSRTPEEASLNANSIDVILVRDIGR